MSRIRIQTIAAEAAWPLRQAVLRPHQSLADCRFPGDDAAGAFHLGGFGADGQLVAVASFSPEGAPAELRAALGPAAEPEREDKDWRLRGMATLPDWRGQGMGQALLMEGLAQLKAQGAAVLWCNARLGALAFYFRLGLIAVGEEFDLPGIGLHRLLGCRVGGGGGDGDSGSGRGGSAGRPGEVRRA